MLFLFCAFVFGASKNINLMEVCKSIITERRIVHLHGTMLALWLWHWINVMTDECIMQKLAGLPYLY